MFTIGSCHFRYLHPDSNWASATNSCSSGQTMFTWSDQRATPSHHFSSPPSQSGFSSSLDPSNSEQAMCMSMLQNVSMALSSVILNGTVSWKTGLSSFQSMKSQQEQAKIMQNASPKSKSRKSPHGLSVNCYSNFNKLLSCMQACVRSVHAALLGREQYKGNER